MMIVRKCFFEERRGKEGVPNQRKIVDFSDPESPRNTSGNLPPLERSFGVWVICGCVTSYL
jgi:hypothetical protein